MQHNEPPASRTATPRVTVVVVPRERFSMARESLDSVLRLTRTPHELLYVDAAGPASLRDWLDMRAQDRGFRVLRSERMLLPAEARNLAMEHVRTPWVVFVDNDVLVTRGWLDALLRAADTSGADVVAPLTCVGLPVHTTVHCAGTRFADDAAALLAGDRRGTVLREERPEQDQPAVDVARGRAAAEVQECQFHCFLMRSALHERIGGFDELASVHREHTDFALRVHQSDGRILVEPSSVVTYVPPNPHRPLARDDWRYFLLRWSPALQRRAVRRIEQAWGVQLDVPAHARASDRLDRGIVQPTLDRVGLPERGLLRGVAALLLSTGLRLASRWVVSRYERARQRAMQQLGTAARPAAGDRRALNTGTRQLPT